MSAGEISDDEVDPYGGDDFEEQTHAEAAAAASRFQKGKHHKGDHSKGGRGGGRENSNITGDGGFRNTDLEVCFHGRNQSSITDDEIEEDISEIASKLPGPNKFGNTSGSTSIGYYGGGGKGPSRGHHRQLSQASSSGIGGGTHEGYGDSLTSSMGGGGTRSQFAQLKLRSIQIQLHAGVSVALRVVAPIGKGEDGDIHFAIRTNTMLESSHINNNSLTSPENTENSVSSPGASLLGYPSLVGNSKPSSMNMHLDGGSSQPPDVFGVKVLPVFDGMDAAATPLDGDFTHSTSTSASHTLDAVRLYRKEIMTLTKLRHRNVLTYYGTAKEAEWLYVVMQYCPGGSLSSLVGQYGALPEPLVILFTAQLLDALTYLHANNVCHRNMTLENLLLDIDDTLGTLQVIIGDFGNSVHRHLFAHRRRTSLLSLTSTEEGDYPAEDDGLKNSSRIAPGPPSPLAPLNPPGAHPRGSQFNSEMIMDEEDGHFGSSSSRSSPVKKPTTAQPTLATILPPVKKNAWGVGAGPAGGAATTSTKNDHMDLWCCGCCVIEMLSGVPLPTKCRDEQSAVEPVLPDVVVQRLKASGSLANVRSFLSLCFTMDRETVTASHLAQHRWVQKATRSDIMTEALEGEYYRQLEAKVSERAAGMRQLASEEAQSTAQMDPSRVKVVKDHFQSGAGRVRSPFRNNSGSSLKNGGGGVSINEGGAAAAVPPLSGRNGAKLPAPGGAQGTQATPRRRIVVQIT